MGRNLLVVLAVVLLIGCGNKEQTQAQAPQGGVDYLQQGMDLLAQNDVPRAIQSFDQAVRQDPTNLKNYMVLGQIYLRLQSYDRAADTFTAATRIAPNDGEVYYFLALSKTFLGPEQQDQALEAAKKSAELFIQSQQKDRFAQALILVKTITEKQAATK